MSFDYNKVKDILVCPVTRHALVHDADALVSTDPESRLSYPVVDDIPRLLEDESETLTAEVWAEIMKRHSRDTVTGEAV